MGRELMGFCYIQVDTIDLFNENVVFVFNPCNLFDPFN